MAKLTKDFKQEIAELKSEYISLKNRMVETEENMHHMHHEISLCDKLHDQVNTDDEDIAALDKTLKMMS